MSQLLILGSAILASNTTETADSFTTDDQVIPKHVIAGYQLTEATLPEGFTAQGYEWIDGAVVAKAPVVVPPVVPLSVSPRQIRQALTRAGLRAPVEAAIAAGDQDTKDWYEFATEFTRVSPVVAALAAALGVTDAQLDDLWTLAGTL